MRPPRSGGSIAAALAAIAAACAVLAAFDARERLALGLFGLLGAVVLWIIRSLQNANRRAEANAATLASMGDGVVSADAAGRVTFMNPAAEALTGWSSEQAVGKPLTNIVQGIKDIDQSAAPIRDRGGNSIGTVLLLRDVTEKRRVEKERDGLLTELVESQALLRTMADNAPVLIWMSGLDRGWTFVNKRWLEFTGAELEEEIGEGWIRRVHPGDLEHSVKAYKDAFEARREFHTEYRLLRRDSQYRWLMAQGVPRRTEAGEFAGYIGSCIDITDHKESEDALRRSNDDLKEFAYAASHDLQQPLRTMSVYSQVLQANYSGKLDDRADRFLLGIASGARTMSGLVRDLLAFVEAGDDDSALEPVDCCEVLQMAVASHREVVKETGAVVTSGALPVVYAQQARVVQLFEQIIGNALKYRSVAPPRIHVNAEREGGAQWVVSVRDNGIGIDPKYHTRIFGLFKKLHGDEYSGTGIGLAICTRIVERYGGRIWLESGREKGSTFYFTLPGIVKGA